MQRFNYVALYFLYKTEGMSETNVYVTQETFDKMREELQRMKSIDRPAASRAIAEAREKGFKRKCRI